MTVVTKVEYAVPSNDEPFTHARILHSNVWGSGGTATASSTATGYDADAPLNTLTYEQWQPTSAPATWERDYGSALTVDTIGLAAHTLGTAGATCLLEYEGASRTNELDYANQLDDASWVKNGASVTANNGRAPDDTVTMDKLIEDTSTGSHVVYNQAASLDSSLEWSASIFVRTAGRGQGRLRLWDITNSVAADADFNLGTETVTLSTIGTVGGDMEAKIEKVREDIQIWRISLSGTLNTTGGSATIRLAVYTRDAGGNVSYTGDGSSGLLLWGAQLEQGPLTPLITTGSTPASSTWYAVTPWFFPADDSPIMAFFDPVSAQNWRLNIEAYDSAPSIGVFNAGEALQMERPIYGGHAPITLARQTILRSNYSDTGEYLGRTKQRTYLSTSFAWNNLTAAWIRSNWPSLQNGIEAEPFWIAWRPASFGEVGFCQVDEVPIPQNIGVRDLMSVSMNVRARGYD